MTKEIENLGEIFLPPKGTNPLFIGCSCRTELALDNKCEGAIHRFYGRLIHSFILIPSSGTVAVSERAPAGNSEVLLTKKLLAIGTAFPVSSFRHGEKIREGFFLLFVVKQDTLQVPW